MHHGRHRHRTSTWFAVALEWAVVAAVLVSSIVIGINRSAVLHQPTGAALHAPVASGERA